MLFSYLAAALALIAPALSTPLYSSSEAAPTCTTTLAHLKVLDLSPTLTVYKHTSTATAFVDCAGCSLTINEIGGVGPVRHITATVTDHKTVETVTACSTGYGQ